MRTEMGISSRLWRRLAAPAVALVVAVGLVAAVPTGASGSSGAEGTVLSMVDASRSSAGLPKLSANDVLAGLASRHSDRMAGAGRIFHNTALPDEISSTNLSWKVVGENVGVGPTVTDVEDAFMASPTHRRNILSDEYNAIGIAVVRAGDGRVYVTQVFAELGRAQGSVPSTQPRGAQDDAACARTLVAEDGTRVPPSFYGRPC